MYYQPKALGFWWLFYGPEKLWCMAQALYTNNYRVYYLNSKMVELEAQDVANCVHYNECTRYSSLRNCRIPWYGANPECAPLLPSGSEILNVKYFVWRKGRWLTLPPGTYRKPGDSARQGNDWDSFDELLDPRNYEYYPESSWAANHGKIPNGARL